VAPNVSASDATYRLRATHGNTRRANVEPSVASKTALATSLVRALHTRADPQPIINDPWGDRLVPESALEAIRQVAEASLSAEARAAAERTSQSLLDVWLRGHAGYATVVTRARYTEDAVQAAVARGVRQYVLVGAGFDSYALRTPESARHIQIFEIDHPATQTLKKRRIADCGVALRESVHFLAADLSRESVSDVLARSAHHATEPSVFSWLGVTMYLTREANLSTLRAIAQSAAPGSELIFTYIEQASFEDSESSSSSFSELRRTVKSMGEPFASGFDPDELAQILKGVGFELQEDFSDAQLVDQYDPQHMNEITPAHYHRLARARVL